MVLFPAFYLQFLPLLICYCFQLVNHSHNYLPMVRLDAQYGLQGQTEEFLGRKLKPNRQKQPQPQTLGSFGTSGAGLATRNLWAIMADMKFLQIRYLEIKLEVYLEFFGHTDAL